MNFALQISFTRRSVGRLCSLGLGFLFLLVSFRGKSASVGLPKDVDSFPVPKGNPLQLFYLQRTANTNTIICELNTNAKGQPIPEKPVNVYWIVYTEGGARKELNYIQRNFAYGIDAKSAENGSYKLHFVSYKKRVFDLKWYAAANRYQVFAPINNKEAILQRIFVKVEGGSFWVPNIVYVEFRGIDPATGKEVFERFKP